MDNITKQILNRSYPLYLGYTLVLFYNVCDIIIIGRLLGKEAVAGVGSVSTIMFVIQGFLLGFSHGFSAIASHYIGKDDTNGFKKAIGNALSLCVAGSIALSLVLVFCMPFLLRLLNTQKSFYDFAYSYIITISCGIIIMCLYNLLGALLCAVSKSKLLLWFSAIMLVINVALDYLFIKFVKLGTVGAALSTLSGFFVCTVIAFIYIIKKEPRLHIKKHDLLLKKEFVKPLLKSGLPMMVSHSAKGVGAAFVQSAFNTFSLNEVAAVSVFFKIEHFATDAFCALGSTACNFVARSIGRGEGERAKSCIKKTVIIGLFASAVTSAFLILFCKYFTPLLITKNVSSVSNHLVTLTNTVAPFLFLLSVVIILRYALFGLKLPYLAAITGIAELLTRVIMSFIARRVKSFTLTAFCYPVSWAVATSAILLIYFKFANKCLKK